MQDGSIDHDDLPISLPKLPQESKITLSPIEVVLPFDGVRNHGSRSSVAQRVWLTYQTEPNDWQPKVVSASPQRKPGLLSNCSSSVSDGSNPLIYYISES